MIDTTINVISVPEDYASIQEALDSADAGFQSMWSGTYFENIEWPDTENLALIGSGSDSTIIDGNQNGRVIKVGDGASSPLEISGFTITNGSTNGRGGGMQIKMTGDILLSDLIISNNQANSGGGIIVEGIGGSWNGEAHVTVENVIFSGNHALVMEVATVFMMIMYPHYLKVSLSLIIRQVALGVACIFMV